MWLCARCLGVLIGQLLGFGALIGGFLVAYSSLGVMLSILLLYPMGVDWSLQEFMGLESSNWRRLVTGLLGGLGLTIVYVQGFLFLTRNLPTALSF